MIVRDTSAVDDRNAPATKGDISDAVELLRGETAQFRAENKLEFERVRAENRLEFERVRAENKLQLDQLRAEMNHGYNDLVERMDDGQTALLKAFSHFAESNQKRMIEVEGN